MLRKEIVKEDLERSWEKEGRIDNGEWTISEEEPKKD